MDPAESLALRQEILDEIAAMLRDELAADSWGRVLVNVVRGRDGEPLVAGIDVEEVLCDDAKIDEVFGSEKARALAPVLAKAVEALCGLDGLDLDEVGGGTFVRHAAGGFGWLPALVHAPSAALDAEREELLSRLRSKNARLEASFGFPGRGRAEVDLRGERLSFTMDSRPAAAARATLLGTFAPRSRTWGWGSAHPHAPAEVRRASAALVDAILDRRAWELSTPVFATDEATAWVLAAWVTDRAGADGVLCSREAGGLVFFLLRDFRDVR
ncbi:MAG TPA: hypothetical protein VEK07_24345 [Polyangiaceae bacterium]|nr:hypothetical protein [Polyangiaceae bacterium]